MEMASKRKRTIAPETSSNPMESYPEETQNVQICVASGYEKCREQRIRENLERMKKLGIMDLSLKAKSLKLPKSSIDRRTSRSSSPLLRHGPVRRSSRLVSLLREIAPETSPSPSESCPEKSQNAQVSEASEDEQCREQGSSYEQCREQRIRENLERMRKLGIMDLSLKAKSLNPLKRTPKSSIDRRPCRSSSPLLRHGPVRRSSRLVSLLREIAPETSPNPSESCPEKSQNVQVSEASEDEQCREQGSCYEQCREQRIRENLERMKKLGIMNLSLKVKSLNPMKRTPKISIDRKRSPSSSPLLRQKLVRRSSRLQNVSPVSYSEVSLSKRKHKEFERKDILLDQGTKPEFYTEEHEKLLVSCPEVSLSKRKHKEFERKDILLDQGTKPEFYTEEHEKLLVSCPEVSLSKKHKTLGKKDEQQLDQGAKPQLYTEEHEKLLGSTKMSRELFNDGYGTGGRKIYDPVNGKTCHQCRQKTLGHRTQCSKCQMLRGQFCGDCLFTRYGEHVVEAMQNLNWICPPCRGICNCSFCRKARGWSPTGLLYNKIRKLGYKSVAHYLLETESEKIAATTTPLSAKRSLAFADTEVPGDEKEGQKSTGGSRLEHCEETAGHELEDKTDAEALSDKKESPS